MKLLVILLSFLSFGASVYSQSEEYVSPDLDRKIFDHSKLTISEQERKDVSTAIGTFIKNAQNTTSKEGLAQSSKLLGVALMLDNTNRESIIINEKLGRGISWSKTETLENGIKTLTPVLLSNAKKLRETSSLEDQKLASYLYELAIELNPKNEDAMFELATMKNKVSCDWSWAERKTSRYINQFKNPAFQQPKPPVNQNLSEVKQKQAMVKGLVVIQTESGITLGQILDIILTFTPSPHYSQVSFYRDSNIGKDMRDSLAESVRYIKTKYPNWERGKFAFSFGDKYNPKDGGSASGAFTLTLLSAFEGITISQLGAMTGDITVDGKLREVGGVIEKIRASFEGKCKFVCIPEGNQSSYDDYFLMYGNESLKEILVYSLTHIDEAKTLFSRSEEAINESYESFQKIISKVNIKYPHNTVNKEEVLAELDELISKSPNLLNAKILQALIKNECKKNLSLGLSLEKVVLHSREFLMLLKDKVDVMKDGSYVNNYGQVVRYQRKESYSVVHYMRRELITEVMTKNAIDQLELLSKIIDPKLKDLNDELIAFIKVIEKMMVIEGRYAKQNKRYDITVLSYYKQYLKSRDKINDIINTLQTDSALHEKLLKESL